MVLNLKKGELIKYQFDINEPWTKAFITGRVVKINKKKGNVNWFNVQNSLSGADSCVNFDDVITWKRIKKSSLSLTRLQTLVMISI